MLRSFHPNRTYTQIFALSLSICNSIYVNPKNEIKKRSSHTTWGGGGGGGKGLFGAIFLLMKAMQRNCTTILRITKSNVQKSGNIRKSEVTNTPGY